MGRVMSLVRFCVGFAVIMVLSLITMVLLPFLFPFRVTRIKLCNIYGKVCGRSIVWLAGVTPNVTNWERLAGSMPAIYVTNHTSTLDAFLCVWLCPIGACGVFKKEIVYVPFYGQIAYLSGHLLIDRGNKGKAVEALREIGQFMKKNRLGVWIMPEGTRSRDGSLLPFKRGFVHLAIATGLPVVPVVIHGAYKNWVTGKFLQFNPMTLDVEVLPPLDTSSWKEETASVHADSVRDIFVAKLAAHDQAEAKVPAAPLVASLGQTSN